jgi:hypothetical protein
VAAAALEALVEAAEEEAAADGPGPEGGRVGVLAARWGRGRGGKSCDRWYETRAVDTAQYPDRGGAERVRWCALGVISPPVEILERMALLLCLRLLHTPLLHNPRPLRPAPHSYAPRAAWLRQLLAAPEPRVRAGAARLLCWHAQAAMPRPQAQVRREVPGDSPTRLVGGLKPLKTQKEESQGQSDSTRGRACWGSRARLAC